MFLLLRYCFRLVFERKKQRNICILGLDDSGKSSLLNDIRRKFQKSFVNDSEILPTVGLNYSQIQLDGFDLTFWDLGGMKRFREIWESYYQDIDVLLWVVDSSNPDRFKESIEEFKKITENENLIFVPLCIVANKQDKVGAIKSDTFEELFRISELRDRKTFIFETSCVGDFPNHLGVDNLLEWIIENLRTDEISKKRFTWRKSYQSQEIKL